MEHCEGLNLAYRLIIHKTKIGSLYEENISHSRSRFSALMP